MPKEDKMARYHAFLELNHPQAVTTPTLLIPGWACNLPAMRRVVDHLSPKHWLWFFDYQDICSDCDLDELADLLDRHRISQIRIIAHSLGAYAAVRIAEKMPSKIVMINLYNPVGLVRPEAWLCPDIGFWFKLYQECQELLFSPADGEIFQILSVNIISKFCYRPYQVFSDTAAIASFRLFPRLNGIKTLIVCTAQDRILPSMHISHDIIQGRNGSLIQVKSGTHFKFLTAPHEIMQD